MYWICSLWLIDILLWISYPLKKAYRLSLRHRKSNDRDTRLSMTYGETPYGVLEHMMSNADAQPGQQFLECGCGTGRLSLMAAKGWGLQVVGFELVAPFVHTANRIQRWLRIPNCQFVQGDMFEQSWHNADIVYVTSTTFPLLIRRKMNEKWVQLKSGTHIYTLTYPPDSEVVELLSSEVLNFSWGAGTLFHAVRK